MKINIGKNRTLHLNLAECRTELRDIAIAPGIRLFKNFQTTYEFFRRRYAYAAALLTHDGQTSQSML